MATLVPRGSTRAGDGGADEGFQRIPSGARLRGRVPIPGRVAMVLAAVAAVAIAALVVSGRTAGVTARPVSSIPPARLSAAMAYDSSDGITVMYGGQDAAGHSLFDTWLWNGGTWSRVAATPGPRVTAPALADDPADGGALLVGRGGALTQTWLFRSGAWQTMTDVGEQPLAPVLLATVPNAGTIVAVADTSGQNCAAALPTCSPAPGACVTVPPDNACVNDNRVLTWSWSHHRWTTDSQHINLYNIRLLVPTTGDGRLELLSVVAPPIPACVNAGPGCPIHAVPAVSFHWGTDTWVSDETATNVPRQPAGLLAEAGSRAALVVPEGESWVLSDGAWVELPGSSATAARYGAAFALDRNGEWILFGGTTPTGGAGDDTWVLTAGAWRHLSGAAPATPSPQSARG